VVTFVLSFLSGIPISIGTGMCELMYKPNATSSADARKQAAERRAAKKGRNRGGAKHAAEMDALIQDFQLLVDI